MTLLFLTFPVMLLTVAVAIVPLVWAMTHPGATTNVPPSTPVPRRAEHG
jgi:hypothetical protein